MIEWCANGGLETRSDVSVANDLIDVSQVAFGTYFDGVMASDVRLLRVADLARILTTALPVRTPSASAEATAGRAGHAGSRRPFLCFTS